MDDNVVRLGRRQPPPAAEGREPKLRPIGVSMPGAIRTGNLEEHFRVDRHGDSWMPITFITVGDGAAVLLMNCADEPAGEPANDL